ncbi:MAG: DMT family transporter, partial [Alphaproteobacteria bacterium]|nr:DMT family transporter [Alphaproteobacteria bacterium]
MSAASLIPGLWVLIWAGSFVSAHVAAPHAEPLGFLAVRFVLSAGIFAVMARLAGKAWPTRWPAWRDALVVGALLHGVYLSCMFYAMWHGLPAGVAALVGGLQPLVTAALVGPWLGERVTPRHWLGIALGFGGVALVVAPKLGATGGISPAALTAGFAAMLAFTLGTVWQKRVGAALDLRVGATIQFIGALILTAPVAALTEAAWFDGSWPVWGAMLWCVLAISI